jgi:hypothetical protein
MGSFQSLSEGLMPFYTLHKTLISRRSRRNNLVVIKVKTSFASVTIVHDLSFGTLYEYFSQFLIEGRHLVI